MNKKVDDFFLKSPDNATETKINIFKKYFKIYFKIINNTRSRSNLNQTIKFIDLFSGPGYFNDLDSGNIIDSTPIHILDDCIKNKYSDLEFFFNDCNGKHIELLKDRISQLFPDIQYNIRYSVNDARSINLNNLITSNDIVLSLIDSYSYLGLDKKTINKLVSNSYSDVVCYFRIFNILEHIGNNSEKNNHMLLFGDEEKYREVIKIKNDFTISQDKKVDMVLKILINNINSYGPKKYFLPFFIKFSSEESKIESVIMIISKNLIGLEKVIDMIEGINVANGKIYLFNDINRNIMTRLDFEKENIVNYIGYKKINVNELLRKINEEFISKYGYISGYSMKYIKNKLVELENNNKLDIEYISSKKRRKGTFSEKTLFCLKENDDE